jgi:hypothetical protein
MFEFFFELISVSSECNLICVLVKSLAGDVLSLDCSPDDSLLHLKRQIAAAAATQLGLDWPVSMQKLFPIPNTGNDDSGEEKQDDHGVFLAVQHADSLQSLNIRNGDVLAVLIEEHVRLSLDEATYLFDCFLFLSGIWFLRFHLWFDKHVVFHF